MIEPEVTAALGRRYVAFLIDSSLVVATGLGVAFQQSTAFDVIGRDAQGQPLVDPAEFAEIEELLDFEILGRAGIFDRPFVRFQEFGDTVRVFGADSYQLGLLAAVLAAFVVFAIIPMFLHRTIGMAPFGFGIRTTDGRRAGPIRHLLRTIGLAVDLLPVVLPGVVGFLSARNSTLRQRVGDRLSGTTVVHLDALGLADIPTEKLDLRLNEPRPQPSVVDDDTTHPSDAGEAPAADDTRSVGAIPDQPLVAPPPAPSPIESFEAAEASAAAAAAATPPVTTDGDREPVSIAPSMPPETSSVPERPEGEPSTNEPSPTPRTATSEFGDTLPPPPVHRGSTSEPVDAPTSTADTSPASTDTASADPDAADRTSTDRRVPTEQVDAPTARPSDVPNQAALPLDLADAKAPPSGATRPDATWQPPQVQPAPVWQPSPLEPAPIEAPDPHDGRTLDDVVLPDPSTGSLVSESPIPEDSPLREQTASTTDVATTATAKSPVWSDKWRAWMYWDPKRKTWLRHDTASNTWKPVS